MATVLASAVMARVSVLLQDTTNIRWPKSELLDWLNDGQRDIVLFKPNACVRNIDVALTPGTKQSLPSDGAALIEITRNTGGGAVRITSREVLDSQMPNWHTAPQSLSTIHYTYSSNDPKTFYVYPPAKAGASLELVYSASPANATENGPISIDDMYASALVDYIAYRAYSKDIEYAQNAQSAASHQQAFMGALTGKATSESAVNPNATKGNPNVARG